MKYILAALTMFSVPAFAFAQTSRITAMVDDFITFINVYVVTLIFAIAFIVFLWGVFKYFILGGGNEESRNEGKQFIMYGLIGFVIMISLWGLVAIANTTLGLNNNTRPCLPTFGGKCNPGGGNSDPEKQYFDQAIDGFTNQP